MKLGFCFLVKEGLSHCSLWESFFASVSPDAYGVYVHAKNSAPHPVLVGSCVDPAPIHTAWGDRSLVAASQRLLSMAIDDDCDSMVLLSGDMLPLQSFRWIQEFCGQTRFSVQPQVGLSERQIKANVKRFSLLSDYLCLSVEMLKKQNMFFSIKRDDFLKIVVEAEISEFPLHELADEYYWINHLIRIGAEWKSSNVVFCNSDPTKTQALVLNLTPDLLDSCFSDGYAFIRKIADINAGVIRDLRLIYSA